MNISRHHVAALTLAAALGAGPAFAAPAFAAEETRTVPAFTAVSFGGKGEVHVVVGKPQSVVLEGDKDLLARVTTEVRDGALRIKYEDKSWWQRLLDFDFEFDFDNRELKVNIGMSHLTALSIAGAGRADATGVDGDEVKFALAGAGRLRADGHVEKVTLSITGAGDADLDNLAADEATVAIVGAGKVNVQPTERLAASIIGAGAVIYTGDPHVTSSITGAGSVRKQ